MDLWLIAGYITKRLRNASKGTDFSSEELSNVKLESPSCLAGNLVKEENFGENVDVFGCGNVQYGVEVAASSESFAKRAFLTRNQRYRRIIKPFSTETNVIMSPLHRENMYLEEYMRSPFPSPPCGSVSRPLVVTNGTKVISQHVPNCEIPQLNELECSGLYVKRRDGTENSASTRPGDRIESKDATLLLSVGISFGIMSSFVAKQTKGSEIISELKQKEIPIEDEMNTKGSLTVKDDSHNGDEKKAEKTEDSISKIEAELEAELERLEININSSKLEPEFEVEFAQGELRDDLVKRQCFDETESNQDPSENSTPESGNYTVSPRELSLRLYKVINSRYEDRIKELETALQESQRKLEQLSTVTHVEKKHDPAEIQPLVMNLAGEALYAFNESYEELMDINDYSEENDLQFENDQQEELSLTSKSSHWSHKDEMKESPRTSEDVSLLRLQDLLGWSDEEGEEDGEVESEMEKQLIRQIVEKTKQGGSSAVLNAQKMLFLMEEN